MYVVKIGGSVADRCPGLLDELARRRDVVLVHGYGPQTTRALEARGIEPRFVTSPTGVRSRFTDEDALAVMREAARGVGAALTLALEDCGAEVAWFGPGDGLFSAEAKPALRSVTDEGRVLLLRGNRSGRVTAADCSLVRRALEAGHLPLVSPFGHDEAGLVSVDGDRAAAALAGSLGADAIVLLTDVPGYLEAYPDPASRVERLPVASIEDLLGAGADAGMVRKLVACREALDGGVPRALIASALVDAPLARALKGDATEVVQ